MVDRIQSDQAAQLLGISKRQVQLMAARGGLPGACKVGGVWTFNPLKLQSWIEEKELELQEKSKTKLTFATPHSTFEPSLLGRSTHDRLEQAMDKLRIAAGIQSPKKRPKRIAK